MELTTARTPTLADLEAARARIAGIARVTPVYPYFLPFFVNLGSTSVRIVNQRSRLLETIREERKAAFDFYAAVRNAYVQRRENQVGDRQPKSEESDDDLYDVDYGDDGQ